MKKSAWFFLFLRIVIGGLFIYSGYSKLLQPSANFAGAILSYQIVGAREASWLAIALPWGELVAGVFFVLGLWLRPALFFLWSLNSIFIIAITSALMRKLPIESCGCFGEGAKALPLWATLVLDGILFFIFLGMSWAYQKARQISLDRWLET